MSRHRQKSSRKEVVVSDDEESEKFYSKKESSYRISEISKKSEKHRKSKKSGRKEIDSNSDDDDNLGKIYSKDQYSRASDVSKKSEKHKKSKKSSKKQSESSSESDGGYDSRKENKTVKKHRKKSSKDKYEKKPSEKSDMDKRFEEAEIHGSDKNYESDSTEKMEISKNSRKRSRSREKQRYGKWADEANKKKDKSARGDDRETSESKSKRMRREDSCERQSSNKHKNDSYDEEMPSNYHQRKRTDYDDAEDYRKSSKYDRRERPDKYSRTRLESDNESWENLQRNSSSNYDERNRYHESGRHNRKDPESGVHNRRDPESGVHNRRDPESGVHNRRDPESGMHNRRDPESGVHNRRDPESGTYNRKDPDSYDRSKNYEVGSRRNRDDYDRDNRKMPRKPYVDLDNPNQMSEENRFSENDVNRKTQDEEKESKEVDDVEPLSKRDKIRNINTRTGGAYIPPAKLRMMQERIKDKGSEEYQRIAWEALKKSIVGMTNKVNSSNISDIVIELFKENIIRGRGVLTRAIMQAQGASPTFTRVYAALVSVINTKFPEIGELILKRLVIQYKRGFRRNDKTVCMNATRFLAHLLNQEVVHEVLILEIVTHLLENPTEDSIEIAIVTLKECGQKLTQLSAKGMRAITETVRNVLHAGDVAARVRYMIEVFFAVQKDGFKDFETVIEELDLVEDDDKYTHFINLDEVVVPEDTLNIFKFDPHYIENEEKYKSVAKEILGDSEEEAGSDAESGSEEEEDAEEKKNEESQQIIDMTETNIVCLRRKIYLTIQSSLDFEECAHKLLKLELKPGQILEMCYMILDCCAQQRTYEKFFGLLGQRFCQLNKIYVEPFTEIFENSYKTIHRLETNKLRNVAKFFAHLLYTDAISWNVLSIIKLNENDTTSSSRIFIKILFQELCEYMGLTKLNERVKDVTLQEAFDGLFPRDLPHNTRFAINFFTSIGLGGLTDELREHLKNLPKTTLPVVAEQKDSASSLSASSSSSSSSSSASSSSSDSD